MLRNLLSHSSLALWLALPATAWAATAAGHATPALPPKALPPTAGKALPKPIAAPVVKPVKPAKPRTAHKEHEAEHEHNSHHWGYTGPQTGPGAWARMNPAFALCGSGKEQSPVNITATVPQSMDKLRFSYGLSRLQMVNNGHTIQVNVDAGSQVEIMGEPYALKQFHFHTPSEEQINGKPFAMNVHLVHQAEDGRLAVVAVLFKAGRENPLLKTLWERMPVEAQESRSFEERMISPASLLPEKPAFYTFTGSLTTPPCSEGVRWVVMKTPVELSAAQLARFRQAFPMNARPVQPINNRMIVETM